MKTIRLFVVALFGWLSVNLVAIDFTDLPKDSLPIGVSVVGGCSFKVTNIVVPEERVLKTLQVPPQTNCVATFIRAIQKVAIEERVSEKRKQDAVTLEVSIVIAMPDDEGPVSNTVVSVEYLITGQEGKKVRGFAQATFGAPLMKLYVKKGGDRKWTPLKSAKNRRDSLHCSLVMGAMDFWRLLEQNLQFKTENGRPTGRPPVKRPRPASSGFYQA